MKKFLLGLLAGALLASSTTALAVTRSWSVYTPRAQRMIAAHRCTEDSVRFIPASGPSRAVRNVDPAVVMCAPRESVMRAPKVGVPPPPPAPLVAADKVSTAVDAPADGDVMFVQADDQGTVIEYQFHQWSGAGSWSQSAVFRP